MTNQQIQALLQIVKRVTRRHKVRISNGRRYALLGVVGQRVKEPAAHAMLDALHADGLRLICEPQARRNADAGLFEYVGLRLQ